MSWIMVEDAPEDVSEAQQEVGTRRLRHGGRRTLVSILASLAIMLMVPGADASAVPSDEPIVDIEAFAAAAGISVEEAMQRHQLRIQATPAILAVGEHEDHFAGVFQTSVDEPWTLNILFVGDEASARERIEPLVPNGLPVLWRRVDHSYARLSDIKDEVVASWQTMPIEAISSVSVDVPTNRVVVRTPSADPQLRSQLTERYSDAVAFEIAPADVPVACNSTSDPEGGSRYSCTPWRGGIELQEVAGSHSNRCSSMMWARRKDSSGHKFLITAGHCGNLSSQTFYHNGAAIGVSTVNSLTASNPRSDARRIPALGNTTKMNKVCETPTSKSYPITRSVYWTNQLVNDWVCKLGVGNSPFGRSCGVIIDYSTTMTQNGKVMPAKQADFNGANSGYGVSGGDSGASVVYNGGVFGLAATSAGKYSTAVDIEYDLNVWLCLNSDCTAP